MNPLLIISPHLDDAVLSCGAAIAQQARMGQQVVVATVFTHAGDTAAEATKLRYTQRQQEDQQAIEALGARHLHMGFTDAPFRNAAYHNFSSLLFHHRLPQTEVNLTLTIADVINMTIEKLQPAITWFPLGTGGHIDHHIVFESSLLAKGRMAYYEELPYSLLNGWSAVRWNQLGASPVALNAAVPLQYMPLTAYPFAFLHNYIEGAQDQASSTNTYNKEWEALANIRQLPVGWQLQEHEYNADPGNSHAEDFEHKCRAIKMYTTEWPALFGPDPSDIENTLATQLREGLYGERRWYKL